DFFRTGGHSLRVMRLVNVYRQQLHIKVTVQELFTHTTIAAQALLLTSRTTSAYEEIAQIPAAEDYAVSAGQRRLWSSSQFDGTSQAYHLPEVIMLEGVYTPLPFEQAINYAMARHEILRTVFRENAEGELRQVVLPVAASPFHFTFTDATAYTAEELAAFLQQQQESPFDLANGPLLRAGLIRRDETHYILHFNMHHIISDGWSLELLSRELLEYYNSYARGEEPVTAPLRIQYKDYAAWQQRQLASDGFVHHRNYWQRQLSGELPVLALPAKKPRPAILTHTGRCLSTVIGQRTIADFQAVCARYQDTLFMGLLSVLKGLLYRYTGQEDIIIGSPVAGRAHTELEDQIGFYVNTMALRTRFDGNAAFAVLLDGVREVTLSAYDHQQYPFDRLVEDLDLRRDMSRYPLFDIVLVLQSQFGNSMQADTDAAPIETIIDNGPCAVKLDMHISFVEKTDGLHMDLQFNSDVFEQDTVVRLMEHFRRMIHQVTANPEMPVSSIAYLSDAEQQQLLHTFNDTPADYGANKNILDLFATTVKEHANDIAISYKDQQLTFRELDDLSDRMACYLKEQYHIHRDDIIVLKLSRSEWMMVTILGILKAGAAYAPVDVNYPQDRIDFIIEDSGSKLIIDETVLPQIQAALQEDKQATPVLPAIAPQQLAYVIYTSGSTGRPKGVQIEHAGLYNHLCYCLSVFMPEKEQRYKIPLFTSVSFDLTVPSLFCSLLNGGELVIYPQEDAVSDIMEDIFFGTKNINFLKCTPSHIDILGAATLRPSAIEGIIIGGEELKHTHVSLLRSVNQEMRIFNEYGPTEATVGCIVNPLVPGTTPASGRSIPIGKPVTNSRIYILDTNRRLCPVGITGELYIGGVQLARGYFNRPDLTADRFIADPFIKGEKIYRSGDLACWLPDGNIEYQGRIDDQVKIRGYRIELGEIEHALVAINNISAATVQVKEEADGQKVLVGYMVSREPLNVTTLRQQLQERLPEHMIPAHFVQLPALPLTANGKIDKRALPEHSSNAAATGTTYAAPRNSVEEKLVEIFESIFRKQGIGIRDGFIDLGGDSIKAILLASKLKQQGYSIKIGEILKYPTVEQLAVRVGIAQQTEQPDNIEGNVALTPIQRLFMEKEYPAMHHYNQSVLLYSKEVINVQLLRKCFTALLEHHDALRMVYRKENGGWTQYNKGKIYAADLFDIQEYGPAVDPQEMRSHCDHLQESINLTEGPLVKLGLFHLPDGDRLLIIIHHLVVDGVSWRILLEDLSTLYHMLLNGETPQLPLKSDSFQQWAEKLQQYANSDAALSEMAYWENTAAEFSGKRRRDTPAAETTTLKKSVSFGLDTADTTLLLTRTNKAWRTEINDVLLAALGCSIGAALSWTEVLIALEAHGREEILDGVNIGRTVGWFTSIYPLLLQTKDIRNSVDYLITVKEQLRTVPDKGIGYGILRYLRDDKKEILAPLGDTDITFNYLGDFGFGVTSGQDNSLFSYSGEYKGQDISSRNIVDRGLTVTGMIVEGRLIMNISYNANKYMDAQMKSLSDNYENYLKALITTLSDTHDIYLTPSDLTFKGLTMDEISALNKDNNLEDVYRLSPLQEGIYYHWVTNPATTAYVIQSSYRVQGKLDVSALEKSFDCLTNRHAILRSTFHHEYGTENIQVVRKKVSPDFKHVFYDAAGGDKDQQVDALKQRDRLQGFDLNNGSQMRLTIFELGNSQYEFIWTHHHILMDGWSSSLLIREFYGIYREIINNREPEPVNVNSYVNYIKWLSSLNTAESHAYWNAYLDGYVHATEMPFKKKAAADESYRMNKTTIELDSAFMDELHNLCKDQGITENVFFRSCWSYLLGRYNNSNDVVFGAVVSGRSEEVVGIEHMIGLFSNTIPVRVRYEEGSQVKDLLWSVQQEAIHSLSHHFLSLADIQAGKQQRELFDNIFVYENFPVQEIINEELNGAQGLDKLDVLSTSGYIESNYDFTLQIAPIRDVLKITIIYRDSVYSKESVDEILVHFRNVIDGFMAGVDTELDSITLLPSSDQQALMETNIESEPEDTVVTRFEEKALRRPHTMALIYEGQELTWGELNERANQLARYLRQKGVKRGAVIPLCIDSSPDAIVGIMGILKAGAAYAPIDPSFPQDRINYILDDVHAEIAVSQECYRGLLAGAREVVAMDTDHAAISKGSTDNIGLPLRADELLYIIYTSGSTGKPKGVMISHANMLDYIDGLFDNLPMVQCKSFALVSGIFTDLGNTVLYGSLLSGGCLHLFSKDRLNNGFALCQYFEEHRIDCVKIVPAHWQALSTNDKMLLPERLLIFGGETLYAEIPQRIYATKPSCMVVNHYGPTETTVGKLLHVAGKNKSYDTVIPIGKPFTNSTIYILSKNMQVVPKGIAGELYIGGKGLAAGYWENDKLTAEFFIPDPFTNVGSRIYKTGDLVKQLPDGEIVFLGRADDQVKIRGYRIEPGEIEHALQEAPGVEKGVAVITTSQEEEKELVLYVTGKVDVGGLTAYLQDKLPAYMMPAAIIEVPEFPLLSNGKVDRRELAARPLKSAAKVKEYIAPQNDIEEKLVKIWTEVLTVPGPIGVVDNFFELGGHSIKVIKLLSRISKQFGVILSVQKVFEEATIRSLAVKIQAAIQSTSAERSTGIPKVAESTSYPLSSSQRRLWVINALNKESTAYNMPSVIPLQGIYYPDKYAQAIRALTHRHEILRTVFREVEGEVTQWVIPAEDFDHGMIYTDLRMDADKRKTAQLMIREDRLRPYDLGQAPLFRIRMIQLEDEEYLLYFNIHHIIGDGWSMKILADDLTYFYECYVKGLVPDLEPLAIQYKDYAGWQQERLASEEFRAHRSYWLEQLSGELPVLSLPAYKSRPAMFTENGHNLYTVINPDVIAQFNAVCQGHQATLFMGLMAVMNGLLYRYTGQEDIIIGSPVVNREHPDLENQIGLYLNTIALRTRFEGTDSFEVLLNKVKETTLAAYEHQVYPFDTLLENLNVRRDMSRSPVFDIMVMLQNQHDRTVSEDQPQVLFGERVVDNGPAVVKFDMSIEFTERGNGLHMAVQFNTDVYEKATIVRFIEHYKRLLRLVAEQPQESIAAQRYLSTAEEEEQLKKFNNTRADFPTDKTFVDLFRRQAALTPHNTAIVFEGDKLTYAELDNRSNQLAHYLREKGVKKDALVPVCIDRSLEMPIVLLGILKAGAAYVPLDPSYPKDWIAYVIDDLHAEMVLTYSHHEELFTIDQYDLLLMLDNDSHYIMTLPESAPEEHPAPNHLAYAIYTSGSTGKPKGVLIEHHSLLNFLLSVDSLLEVNETSSILAVTTYSFDIAYLELYLLLLKGGTVILSPRAKVTDANLLIQQLEQYQPTHMQATPSTWQMLVESGWKNDEGLVILTGGEALKRNLRDQLLSLGDNKCWNLYGPTETTIWVTAAELKKQGTVTIGKPFHNSSAYILDRQQRLVAKGVTGELYIGGVQLARGYFNREELTAERFMANPFRPGERLYRTGDQARFLADGTIEYIGRNDDQVKVRGYRIELGEVEHALLSLGTIRSASVQAWENESGYKFLVAYVVSEGVVNAQLVRKQLLERIPEYMVPGFFVQLENLPLTANRKVDRKALPNPEGLAISGGTEYVAPRNEVEEKLVAIWKEVFRTNIDIGIKDNYFELGGESMMAIRILARVSKEFGVSISIRKMFEDPRIESIASEILNATWFAKGAANSGGEESENIKL
ncbi:non-ribosomal peptide synthetase, partial [Chitinophaga varians]|uniref:non-ribosomal peptide synthetase n=1 Tax=Chitinophaga varians TaxID=2202339 RepID=UPI00166004AC